MIACMGGWCASRDRCCNYHTESRANPVERLCGSVEEPDPVLRAQRYGKELGVGRKKQKEKGSFESGLMMFKHSKESPTEFSFKCMA